MLKRAWISTLAILFTAALSLAQRIDPPAGASTPAPSGKETSRAGGPLNNDVAGNARILMPDGSTTSDALGAATQKWYVTKLEHGKSYVLEAIDPFGDLGANCVNTTVYDSDATTTPPADTELDTGAANIAPAMEVSDDGQRTAIRPDLAAAATRIYYIKVTQCGSSFRIRLRESTSYSRWTVNSYNMFVGLQNTTQTDVQCQVLFYSDAGVLITNDVVTVPGFGAAQVTHLHDTLAPNHGALRVQWWGLGAGLVPGHVNVQPYAFNVSTGVYLNFFAERVNDGKANSSW